MSLSHDEIEFWIAYESCRIKGDAATCKEVGGCGQPLITSPARFQAYRPPVIERSRIRIAA